MITNGTRGPLRAAVRLSFEADRTATLISLISFGLRPAAAVISLALSAAVVDAAVVGDLGRAFTSLITLAVIAAVVAGTTPLSMAMSQRMVEASSSTADDRLMSVVGGFTGLEMLDDPALLDRISILQQNRVYLAMGADALSLVLGTVIRGGATAVLLAFINPLLLLAPLIAIPSVYFASYAQRKRADAQQATAASSRLSEHLYATATDPSALEEIRSFGLADTVRDRQNDIQQRVDSDITSAVAKGAALNIGSGLIFAAGFVFVLLVVVRDHLAGSTSFGDILLTLTLITSLNLQISSTIRFLRFLHQARDVSARLLELLEVQRQENTRWAGTNEPPKLLRSGIDLAGLTFSYPESDRHALHAVNAHFPAGSVVALIGDNGAGKSTLIKLLAGLYQPTGGHILIDGQSLTEQRPDLWRSRVTACFQDFGRYEFEVGQDIALSDLSRSNDVTALTAAAREGTALDFIERLPAGLRTRLGRSFDDGVELSGGQWQRLALARARMRREPLLMVLDEPAAAIDPLAEDELLRGYVAAARHSANRTGAVTLFSSHRLSTAKEADVIVVLHEGSIAEIGTHRELLSLEGGRYGDMFRAQALGYQDRGVADE